MALTVVQYIIIIISTQRLSGLYQSAYGLFSNVNTVWILILA